MDRRQKGSQLRSPVIIASTPNAALIRINDPRLSVLMISGQITSVTGRCVRLESPSTTEPGSASPVFRVSDVTELVWSSKGGPRISSKVGLAFRRPQPSTPE